MSRRAADPLGLTRALSDRLLPALVAAMALLAGLALGGWAGAGRLQARWEGAAAAAIAVLLPPETPRGAIAAAAATLAALPGVVAAAPADPAELAALLRPWLGDPPALTLPPLLELRLDRPADAALEAAIRAALPGAVIEPAAAWAERLVALARSLAALALAALGLVAAVAAAVVAVAVRAGIAARRQAIGILHDLGATDGAIAGRFAGRIAQLAGVGGAIGAGVAVPILASLGAIGGPLLGGADGGAHFAWGGLPWAGLAALPPAAAGLGWATAQVTLRGWLRRLP